MHRGLGMPGNIGIRGSNVYDGKIAGLYDLEETLGRGHFAVVKLARHVFTGEKVAVKVIDKSKLDEVSRAHLFQEVRCMKLVQHPNVVRLYEVIDTQTKLYLILELGDGGDLYDYIMRHESGLSEQIAREYFRQIVRAISYCHRLHVVHRDLKPENVVFFEKIGMVKLTDFGFSNKFCPGQKLETSCGSLAYSAPEILLGDSYDAPAVDVWSLGVILYMLVCGQAPFQEANDSETLTMIMDCKYTIPTHVSHACKKLIARMLIREPEKRANLVQIANDPWLQDGAPESHPVESLPLVSRHQVSDEDHNLIIQKMVNGNIASKEDILEALDKNEYNHITATYFLLAERKLRAHRQEQVQRKRPEQLSIASSGKNLLRDSSNDGRPLPNPTLLTIPRTPGDLPQRARKCSIVQEEEDEEDLSSCSGREELTPSHSSLNRRGSRSEGKLNIALQERIAESERRKETILTKTVPISIPKKTIDERNNTMNRINKPTFNVKGWCQMDRKITASTLKHTGISNTIPKIIPSMNVQPGKCHITSKPESVGSTNNFNKKPVEIIAPTIVKTAPIVTTTILNESSTISIPIHVSSNISTQVQPKYKTMPSPTRQTNFSVSSQLQLNEIFEEGDCASESGPRPSMRNFVGRTQNRTSNYEQRRSKFHKARTASCSSSDASDDDSEGRKKRAHKISGTGKPIPGRRDSHDDSSDSQDQGGGGGVGTGGGATNSLSSGVDVVHGTTGTNTRSDKSNNSNNNNDNRTGGKKNRGAQPITLTRRHRNGRRRNGETRLRESQSLNRITEVQEDLHTHVVTNATNTISSTRVVETPKVKGFGPRWLQNWTIGYKKSPNPDRNEDFIRFHHISRKETNVGSSEENVDRNIERSDRELERICSKTESVHEHHEKIIEKTESINRNDDKITRNIIAVDITTKPKRLSDLKTKCHIDEKENYKMKIIPEKGSSKKMRLLGRYFHVHKKLCIPIPGLFSRERLYKTQSCGSLTRDRISSPTTGSSMNGLLSSDGDVNRNDGMKQNMYDNENNISIVDKIVPLKSVCTGIGGICQLHLGDASKCCSLC